MLAFLAGASPWWWIIAGLVLAAAEALSFSLVLIWPALAATTVGLWLFVQPGLSPEGQLVLFAAFSIGFAVAGRAALARRRGAPEDGPRLNRRGARLEGRRVRVLAWDGAMAEVEVDGERWRARMAGDAPTAQPYAVVAGVEGATLLLRAGPAEG